MSKEVEPHIQRIVTERDELIARLAKLDAFTASEAFSTIVPNMMDRELLHKQSEVMQEYANILSERLSRVSAEH